MGAVLLCQCPLCPGVAVPRSYWGMDAGMEGHNPALGMWLTWSALSPVP